jgi:hypothetical protein
VACTDIHPASYLSAAEYFVLRSGTESPALTLLLSPESGWVEVGVPRGSAVWHHIAPGTDRAWIATGERVVLERGTWRDGEWRVATERESRRASMEKHRERIAELFTHAVTSARRSGAPFDAMYDKIAFNTPRSARGAKARFETHRERAEGETWGRVAAEQGVAEGTAHNARRRASLREHGERRLQTQHEASFDAMERAPDPEGPFWDAAQRGLEATRESQRKALVTRLAVLLGDLRHQRVEELGHEDDVGAEKGI